MYKLTLLNLFCFAVTTSISQNFIPNDTIVANNVFQVEFSSDSRSMVWCEQIPLSGGKAKIWYADMDLENGIPIFEGKQLIDTIQGQGWPYWGQDDISKFFLYKNQYGEVKFTRRTGFNTLITNNLGSINGDNKSLLNVSSDSTKNYFWINYTILNLVSSELDSLFTFRSDNVSNRVFINAEKKNNGGSAYELTFPRWLAQSEILAYPFRPFTNQPYWDMKFWKGTMQTSTQVTNDIPASIFNHHVDDLPFTLPQFLGDTFMFSSKATSKLAIYQKNGEYFTQTQLHTSPTQIVPTTLTSFEPFTICGDKTYGAYQVYSGGGIPGTTAGEIYLKGIFNDSLHIKISEFEGDVAVDPEYVIGNNKVWIFYYGKTVGQGLFNLHRCETPLEIPCLVTETKEIEKENNYLIFPNPAFSEIDIKMNRSIKFKTEIFNSLGELIVSTQNQTKIDVSNLNSGIYFVKISVGNFTLNQKLIIQK